MIDIGFSKSIERNVRAALAKDRYRPLFLVNDRRAG
jgi:hypothetical protein